MSPREALSEAERVATIAEKRCQAICDHGKQRGTRCDLPSVAMPNTFGGYRKRLCFTHLHARKNPHRRNEVQFTGQVPRI